MRIFLDKVQVSGENTRHLRKEIVMNTIGSLVTSILLIALIFLPQALAIYFSTRSKPEHEEFVPDGR